MRRGGEKKTLSDQEWRDWCSFVTEAENVRSAEKSRSMKRDTPIERKTSEFLLFFAYTAQQQVKRKIRSKS